MKRPVRIRISLVNNDAITVTVEDPENLVADIVDAKRRNMFYRPGPDAYNYLNPDHIVLIGEVP